MTKDVDEGPTPGPILYSVEEAAGILGIGRTFMFHLIAIGAIESFKIGKHRKITQDAIDTFVSERLREAQVPKVLG